MYTNSPGRLSYFVHSVVLAILSTFFCAFYVYADTLYTDTLSETTIQNIRISVNFRNLPLKEALQQIEKASKLAFIYNKAQIEDTRLVSLNVTDESVAQVLSRLFAQTKVQFRQLDKNIILSIAEPKRTAPTGIIEGTVVDYETNEALVGAAITIAGTNLGTTADASGHFRIGNIPEGVHTLSFSFIGYQPSTVPGVQVKGGTVTRVNHKLVATDNVLGEIVIRPDVAPENTTERLLIQEIRTSRAIVTGISNEQITRSLDFDGAEVVRRGSGVTLVSGRFVMLRGLEPRYTLTLLNDMITPSSENDRKAFSYDMLNSSTIDRIMIAKSPAPELPGDFGGGVVKVYTKSFANARQLQIQVFGQFRPGSSFTNHYTYKGGKYDQLGFDDGTRELPKGLPARREDFPDPDSNNPATQAANAKLARLFPNNWNLLKRYQTIDKRVVINYYDAWNLRKTRLSSLTSLSYFLTGEFRRAELQRGARQIEIDTLTGEQTSTIPPDQTAIDSIYTETARISAMQNFRWVITDRHKLEFRNFFNLLGQDQTLVREARSSANEVGAYYRDLQKTLQYNFRSRLLYTGLLSGEHQLDKKGMTKLNWRTGYAHTTERVPDQRRYDVFRQDSLGASPGPGDYLPGYYRWDPSDGTRTTNARYYSWLEEHAFTISADAERNFGTFLVKAGWFTDSRKRTFRTKLYTPYVNLRAALADDLLPFVDYQSGGVLNLDRNGEKVLNPRNFRADGSGWDFADNSNAGASSRYTASNEQHAGYVALNIPLLEERLNIYGGVRAEWNRLESLGDAYTFTVFERDSSGQIIKETQFDSIPTSSQKRLYWLPSVNVSYRLFPKMLIRVAYGKSLNRPEFREIGPVRYFDLERRANIIGNVKLTNAEIQNFDFRWEWYPKEDQLISIGAFYKDLKKPIESVSTAGNGFVNDEITYLNTDRAKVYGLELEMRTSLDFIPSPLFRYLSVVGNATILKSQVSISESLRSLNRAYPADRPLQGAAPYTINIGLYYDNTNTGTQVSALYNVIGQRLVLAATALSNYSLYEMPRHVIDLSITQRINRRLQIKIGVQDLLNQPFRQYRDVVPNGKFSTVLSRKGRIAGGAALPRLTSDYLEQRYRSGSYYTLGFLFTL